MALRPPISAYQIQSQQQIDLIEALARYPALLLRPSTPPLAFELMGQLSLKTGLDSDRLLISAAGIQQTLSLEWSELRQARLSADQKTLALSDGVQTMLTLQNPIGDLADVEGLMGLLQDLPRLPTVQVRLPLCQNWLLTDILPSDRSAYIYYLNDPLIYQHTLRIPFPYTANDADRWLSLLDYKICRLGQSINLAIRSPDGQLCGGIGIQVPTQAKQMPFKAEIGYWLAQAYWGKGIMSQAVRIFCKWAFKTFGFQRLTAQVFSNNLASEKVLLKAGFVLEGRMTQYYLKDNVLYDGKLYALTPLKEDTIKALA